MKILLLGECSHLHWTLAEGLRALGHKVCVVSNKGNWRGYKQDILLERKSLKLWDSLCYIFKIMTLLPKWRDYDIVQIQNAGWFVELTIDKILILFKYLKRNNSKIFMGAFGTDSYYIKACLDKKLLRYSEFHVGQQSIKNLNNDKDIKVWLSNKHVQINTQIAQASNGIIACLYEYYICYQAYFPDKTTFIPLPINIQNVTSFIRKRNDKIRFFIGIQTRRSDIKGTDIMYRALIRVKNDYPDQCEIVKAENVPLQEYEKLMNSSDVLLDQLYSYTPAMNGLLAMAKGLILVGGGEKENYEILNEDKICPIINVLPNEQDVYNKLVDLIKHPERIPILSAQSIEYVRKHHNHIKVAQQYIDYWNKM